MAGLACALTLHRAGAPVLLFDREELVGGRVRTDEFEGYRLDRGFQVLLTAYPEARSFLNYEELDLRSCYPGSRVWFGNRFHRVRIPSASLWTDWVPCSIQSVRFQTSSELAC